jgi:flagellar biosynthesis protein FlhG
MDAKRTKIIAVSSGKGGVGKTFLSLQLAAALVAQGKRVALFDGDLGLANVHVLLGLKPTSDISDVVAGRSTLQDTILEGPLGISIIPGASGQREMAELDARGLARVLQGLSDLTPMPDFLLIDTGAGIGSHVTTLARLADVLMVVIRNEPASLADAYGLIKVMHGDFGFQKFEIVVNDSTNAKASEAVFTRLNEVAMRFLGLPLVLAGVVPHDDSVAVATRRRQLLAECSEITPAVAAIRKMAAALAALPDAVGSPSFLLDRLGPSMRVTPA